MGLAGACMGLAAWLGADSAFARLLEELRVVYAVELVMVMAFGVAWYVKGEGLESLNDKP